MRSFRSQKKPQIRITIAILIKVESESPNYIFPLHDFLGFRLNFFIALDYVPRMLSTNTLININIEHKRVYTADLLSSQRELMDVNFYVNKAIREICCCYYCRLLLLLLLHIITGNRKIVMYIWKMTILLIIPRDFLAATRKVIKLNRNFYFRKLNFFVPSRIEIALSMVVTNNSDH